MQERLLQWLAPTRELLRIVRTHFTRVTMWVLLASLAVLTATGLPLIWTYRPNERLWYQELHLGATGVFIFAIFALIGSWSWARLRQRAPAISGLRTSGLLILMVFAGGTGPMIAWVNYSTATELWTPNMANQGITAIWQPGVVQVSSNTVMPSFDYQVTALLHIALVPLLLAWVAVRNLQKHPARLASAAAADGEEEEERDAQQAGRKVKPTSRTNAKRKRQRDKKRKRPKGQSQSQDDAGKKTAKPAKEKVG